MSEVTQEREVELVQGTIKGVIVKGVDKWQVEVQPDGSQYTKKLWTKDKELIEAIPAKIGEFGAFVCNASMWTNSEGKPVRSLWISDEADGSEPAERVATPAPAPKAAANGSSDGMTKDEWNRKDSAIHKMACIKTAADALKHTVPSEPTNEQLNEFVTRTMFVAVQWHRSVLAERDDPAGENIPF